MANFPCCIVLSMLLTHGVYGIQVFLDTKAKTLAHIPNRTAEFTNGMSMPSMATYDVYFLGTTWSLWHRNIEFIYVVKAYTANNYSLECILLDTSDHIHAEIWHYNSTLSMARITIPVFLFHHNELEVKCPFGYRNFHFILPIFLQQSNIEETMLFVFAFIAVVIAFILHERLHWPLFEAIFSSCLITAAIAIGLGILGVRTG